jgi:hypothetical protein
MQRFNVTYDHTLPEDAALGDCTERGFVDQDVTLHRAVSAARDVGVNGAECVEPSDSRHDHARWISIVWHRFQDGAGVTASIHFPSYTTSASRARLVRVLSREL